MSTATPKNKRKAIEEAKEAIRAKAAAHAAAKASTDHPANIRTYYTHPIGFIDKLVAQERSDLLRRSHALVPEVIAPVLEDYIEEPDHSVIQGIPEDLKKLMQPVLDFKPTCWSCLGRVFADWVMDGIPKGWNIEKLFEPLDYMLSAVDDTGLIRDFETNKAVASIWMQVRWPDILAMSDELHRQAFIDGAYRAFFCYDDMTHWRKKGKATCNHQNDQATT